MDLKFLVFDSYVADLLNICNFNFFYFSYFPLTFFYSIFEFSSSIFSRLSGIARESSSYFNKFYRRQHSFFFDLDFHISLFLGKGVIRIKVPGLLNFFRYKIQEYYVVHGLEKSAMSLVQSNNEQRIMIPVYPFFKKRFFFLFLNRLKNVFISNLFSFFKFFFFICKNLSLFFSFMIFKKLYKFFFFTIFFKIFYYFFNNFFFFKFFNKFFLNLFFFKFFFFEFIFFFLKNKFKFLQRINFSFILFFSFLFKLFFFKFFNFIYFFFSLDFFKFNFGLLADNKKFKFNFFSNLVLLKFNISLLDNFFNPMALVYNSGFFRLTGFHSTVFSKNFVNFLEGKPFYLFFCFFIFIKFFLFLFFFLFKSNFLKISCDFDFFSSRFFFFRIFTLLLSFFRLFTFNNFF